jgi:hypothetical protein
MRFKPPRRQLSVRALAVLVAVLAIGLWTALSI